MEWWNIGFPEDNSHSNCERSELTCCFFVNSPEVNHMSKARDTKKSDKKKPAKTAKEKKQSKREKKNN
jgi:hypothetical protein